MFAINILDCPVDKVTIKSVQIFSRQYPQHELINVFPTSEIKTVANFLCPIQSVNQENANLVVASMYNIRCKYSLDSKVREICTQCTHKACKMYGAKLNDKVSPSIEDLQIVTYGHMRAAYSDQYSNSEPIKVAFKRWAALSNIIGVCTILPKMDKDALDDICKIKMEVDKNKYEHKVRDKDMYDFTIETLKHCKTHKQKIQELKNLVNATTMETKQKDNINKNMKDPIKNDKKA